MSNKTFNPFLIAGTCKKRYFNITQNSFFLVDNVISKISYVTGLIVLNCYTDFKKGAISAIGLNYKGGNNRDIVCDGFSTLSEPLQNKHWGFPESFTCRW